MTETTDTEPAEIETIDIDVDGMTFTIPKDPDDWPYAASKALEQGRGLTFVEALVGPAQHREWMRLGAGKRTARDGGRLMAEILRVAYGVTPGE